MVRKVGFVDLSKTAKLINKDHKLASNDIIETSAILRKQGVVVDGVKKYIRNTSKLGLHLLGKLDFLKSQGFVIIG